MGITGDIWGQGGGGGGREWIWWLGLQRLLALSCTRLLLPAYGCKSAYGNLTIHCTCTTGHVYVYMYTYMRARTNTIPGTRVERGQWAINRDYLRTLSRRVNPTAACAVVTY